MRQWESAEAHSIRTPRTSLQADDGGHAQNFLSSDRDQPAPPDLRDWLAEDHLAWFVIEAIGELDPVFADHQLLRDSLA